MSLSSTAHNMIARLVDWWRDRQDERLDELVAIYAGQDERRCGLSRSADIQSGVSAGDGHSIL